LQQWNGKRLGLLEELPAADSASRDPLDMIFRAIGM
jgi:hypothetical protein